MALPSSGPISFADFVTEQGFLIGAETNMYTSALIYSVPFQTDGLDPISMDEFYGKEAPRFDVYEALIPGPGIVTYYLFWSSSNPFNALIGDYCFNKLTAPPGLKYGEIADMYPFAQYINSVGAACNEGGDPIGP